MKTMFLCLLCVFIVFAKDLYRGGAGQIDSVIITDNDVTIIHRDQAGLPMYQGIFKTVYKTEGKIVEVMKDTASVEPEKVVPKVVTWKKSIK